MKCNRCESETNRWTCSYFNTESICPSCETQEQAHPEYAKAKEMEMIQVLKGNNNYEGIGLPKDLRDLSELTKVVMHETIKRIQNGN